MLEFIMCWQFFRLIYNNTKITKKNKSKLPNVNITKTRQIRSTFKYQHFKINNPIQKGKIKPKIENLLICENVGTTSICQIHVLFYVVMIKV